MSEEQAAVEETTSDTLLDPSAPTLSEGEYFLSDGIKGTGDVPEWYIADKYKSVSEQAKAYTELEKKFGGFKGSPKDGYGTKHIITCSAQQKTMSSKNRLRNK